MTARAARVRMISLRRPRRPICGAPAGPGRAPGRVGDPRRSHDGGERGPTRGSLQLRRRWPGTVRARARRRARPTRTRRPAALTSVPVYGVGHRGLERSDRVPRDAQPLAMTSTPAARLARGCLGVVRRRRRPRAAVAASRRGATARRTTCWRRPCSNPRARSTVDDPRLSTTYRRRRQPDAGQPRAVDRRGRRAVPAPRRGRGGRRGRQPCSSDDVELSVTPLRCHTRGRDGAGVYVLARSAVMSGVEAVISDFGGVLTSPLAGLVCRLSRVLRRSRSEQLGSAIAAVAARDWRQPAVRARDRAAERARVPAARSADAADRAARSGRSSSTASASATSPTWSPTSAVIDYMREPARGAATSSRSAPTTCANGSRCGERCSRSTRSSTSSSTRRSSAPASQSRGSTS